MLSGEGIGAIVGEVPRDGRLKVAPLADVWEKRLL